MIQPTLSKKLYEGKIIIDFFENQHRYSHRGDKKWIISVTACTSMIDKSRMLMKWVSNLTKDYLLGNLELLKASTKDIEIKGIIENAVIQYQMVKEEAASIGTQVHKWCELYIKTLVKERKKLDLPKDEKILNGVIAFLDWVKNNKVKFIESEKLVYSKKYDYVGLLDLKAIVNGKTVLVDFKTSSDIYPEFFLQACAYRQADEEESKEKYDQVMILHFDKENGEFEVHEMDENEYKDNFKVFLACLELKRWHKRTSN